MSSNVPQYQRGPSSSISSHGAQRVGVTKLKGKRGFTTRPRSHAPSEAGKRPSWTTQVANLAQQTVGAGAGPNNFEARVHPEAQLNRRRRTASATNTRPAVAIFAIFGRTVMPNSQRVSCADTKDRRCLPNVPGFSCEAERSEVSSAASHCWAADELARAAVFSLSANAEVDGLAARDGATASTTLDSGDRHPGLPGQQATETNACQDRARGRRRFSSRRKTTTESRGDHGPFSISQVNITAPATEM